jgi:hypothetical protein
MWLVTTSKASHLVGGMALPRSCSQVLQCDAKGSKVPLGRKSPTVPGLQVLGKWKKRGRKNGKRRLYEVGALIASHRRWYRDHEGAMDAPGRSHVQPKLWPQNMPLHCDPMEASVRNHSHHVSKITFPERQLIQTSSELGPSWNHGPHL